MMAAVFGYAEPLRILCTRDLQNSIKQSFHAELKNAIQSTPWLAAAYDVGVDYLRGHNGTEFIFAGLRHNMGSIKSLAQIDICIVEEAEDVAESAWVALEPTIRAPKSEIWVIWNPKKRGSPIDLRFVQNTPPRSVIAEINWSDNPMFPDVLDEQRRHQQETYDGALYRHIWEGDYYERSAAQVFSDRYRVQEFTPESSWAGPYFGLDFGFSVDPTAAVKCWINDNTLYIEQEVGGVGVEIDQTAELLIKSMQGIERFTVRADSARPESISYLRRHGIPNIQGVKKGAGSVEDGITHIKSYKEVIIHPSCARVASEFMLYSYKVDRLSGDILPVLVDANNHYIDAIRYALEPIMKHKNIIFEAL